jgi:RHS repeat-associated protein
MATVPFSLKQIRFSVFCIIWMASLLGAVPGARGQSYLTQVGPSTFSTAIPVELGYYDASTGDLHLQIPLGSWPQRGGFSVTAALVYDSRIWSNILGTWQPTNIPGSNGGWRLQMTPAAGGSTSHGHITTLCPEPGSRARYTTYQNFTWTDPYGTVHTFPINTESDPTNCDIGNIPSDQQYANDSSGFFMSVTNFTTVSAIYSVDGTQVYPSFEDTNGNQLSADANGNLIDTLGRTPVKVTTNCNQIQNHICYDVLNSQFNSATGTSRYTVTTQSIAVQTSFLQSGVTEYSGNITVVQQIQPPSGPAYTFTYDSGGQGTYGELASVTLPTGGSVSYTYLNFADMFGNTNSWLFTRTPSTGGVWDYVPSIGTTCPSGYSFCQKVDFWRPSGDEIRYVFGSNSGSNGSWGTSQIYNANVANGSLSVATTWTTTMNGAQKASVTTTRLDATSPYPTSTVQYQYLNNYPLISKISEWNYYTGNLPTTPDRITTTTFASGVGLLGSGYRPSSVTTTSGAGTQTISQTNYGYDSYGSGGITSAPGMTEHDDTNFGTSFTARGNPTSIQRLVSGSPSYLTSTMTYDTTGQVTSVTDPAGNKTTLGYADSFYYDNNADPPATYPSTPPTNAYLTKVTQPSVNSNSFVTNFGYYFGTGQTAKSVDVNSQASYANYYDPFSRPTQSVPPIGWSYTAYTSATQIDSCSGISATLNPNYTGCIYTRLGLDHLGRPNFGYVVNNPDGQTTASTNYDNNGRVYTVSPLYRGSATAFDTISYDSLDRPTVVLHNDEASVSYFYGAGIGMNTTQLCTPSTTYGVGYPTMALDEAGKRRESWTDGFGRLIEVDEPNSTGDLTVKTCNKYDLADNLIEVDEGVQTRTYGYDLLGRATSASIPETTPTSGSQKTSYSNYDADSNCASPNSFPDQLVSTVDARGVRTCMQYDALNRVTQVSYDVTGTGVTGTPAVKYHYDAGGASAFALGRLTSMDDALGSGSESYSYDQLGRVTQMNKVVSSVTYTTTYAYNAASELTSITYPASGSHVVQSGYDAIGRLCAVAVSVSNCSPTSGKYASSFTYNAPGQMTGYTYGNNSVVATMVYSPDRMQLTSLGYTKNSTSLFSLTYGYTQNQRNNGQVTNISDSVDVGRTVSYTYDPLARLSLATTVGSSAFPQWQLQWSYDRYGNRTAQSTTTTGCVSPMTCPTNSLSFANPGGAQTNQPDGFSFDANGNMTYDGLNSLAYDAANHLITTNGGPGAATYTYDGNGLRVKKALTSGAVSVYIFSGDNVIAEYALGASASSPSEEYIYSGSQLIATIDSAQKYHLSDHLSIRVTTDSSGNILGQQGHFPFGESWYTANTTTKWQFTSYERDAESGNDYAMARHYSSRLARFTSVDPLPGDAGDPQSLNRYSYVRNDPINLIDPSGMDYCNVPHKSTAENYNREKIWFAYNDVFDGRMGPSSMNSDDSNNEQTPADPNSSYDACTAAGGSWVHTEPIVVNGNGDSIDPWTIGNHTGLLPGSGHGASGGGGSGLGSSLQQVGRLAACGAGAALMGNSVLNGGGTSSLGVSGNVTGGFLGGASLSTSTTVNADMFGNVSLTTSFSHNPMGVGVYGAAANAGITASTSNNPTVHGLSGNSGTVTTGAGPMGVDVSKSVNGAISSSGTFGPGIGGKIAAVQETNTKTIASTNCMGTVAKAIVSLVSYIFGGN